MMTFSGKNSALPRISSFDAAASNQGLPVHRRSMTNDSATQMYEAMQQDPRFRDGSLIEEEMTFEELSSKLGGLHTNVLSEEQ